MTRNINGNREENNRISKPKMNTGTMMKQKKKKKKENKKESFKKKKEIKKK